MDRFISLHQKWLFPIMASPFSQDRFLLPCESLLEWTPQLQMRICCDILQTRASLSCQRWITVWVKYDMTQMWLTLTLKTIFMFIRFHIFMVRIHQPIPFGFELLTSQVPTTCAANLESQGFACRQREVRGSPREFHPAAEGTSTPTTVEWHLPGRCGRWCMRVYRY